MSSGGHVASSSACAHQTRGGRDGSTGNAAPDQLCSPIGHYAMATAGHREPCDSRASCTVLGAPGGETPPGDSTKASSQQGEWYVRFTPDRVGLAALSFCPRGAQRPVVRSLLHRGCTSTLDLFMRRFAVETFDPKRRGNEAIWARWKSRLETEFFGEGELMVRKPRAPAMSKEAMRQESERLVREAMARNVTFTQGKTRLDVKCSKCGAPNRVSAEVDHGRVEYACKECGHKQKTL